MAFLNRVGKLLKQNLSKHVNSELSAPKSSVFQAIRNMSSSSKLFVGGLSYSTDEMSLRDAFAKYGDVIEARVILDRDTGRSRGFAFITYTSTEAASSAIQAFDGQELHGRRIRVNYATERPRGGGFGGGFGTGGGYNYGDQGGNYGSGGYQGGGYGGSRGGNYPGGGGNFSGDGGYGGGNQYPSGGGGFGGNQFPSGGGGFGQANNFPSGGGSSYGGGDVQDDGNYGGGGGGGGSGSGIGGGSGSGSGYSGSSSGFSPLLDEETTGNKYSDKSRGFASLLDNDTTGTYGEIQEPPIGDGIDKDFGQDPADKIDKDEPNDYANNRS